jgi:mannan endo-1,4-beta-mannosidase
MKQFFPLLLISCITLSVFSCGTGKDGQDGFVRVSAMTFTRNGKPYTFMGTNFWYGLNIGSNGEGGNRARLIRELDRLSSMGVKNLRIMAGSEGPDTEPYRMVPALQTEPGKYNEEVLAGLDFLLTEMAKRDMVAVMCLNNFWNWSGGMGQYLVWAGEADSIPYPPPQPGGDWQKYQEFAARFYSSEKAMKLFEDHIRFIVSHKNSISGKLYKHDPVIMSWELGNEPRGINNREAFLKWVDKTAGLIKQLDSNHLVTTGSEGNTSSPSSGTDMIIDHQSKNIDYATMHIWVQNWGYYDPKKADSTYGPALNYALDYLKDHIASAGKLVKPVVLEEFGISRDKNDHAAGSSVTFRDKYYSALFDAVTAEVKKGKGPLAGVNFWAWAGEGRPRTPAGLWNPKDDFIGDPPHEGQGWYSVYDTDSSTIAVIKKYALLLSEQKK